MSDVPSATPRRARPRSRVVRRRPSTTHLTIKLGALAAAVTLAIGAALAVQMAHGADPALGPKAAKTVRTNTVDTWGGLSPAGSSAESSPSILPGPSAPQVQSQPTPVTTRAS